MENFQRHFRDRPLTVVVTNSLTELDKAVQEELGLSDEENKIVRRKCTDIFWLILFGLVWIGVIVICIYGYRLGDLQRLVFPRDSEGNLCGSSIGPNSQRDLSSMPYLVYFSLSFSGSYRRCSSSCYDSSSPYICMYGISNDTATLPTNLFLGYCAATVPSTPFFYRCIPDLLLGAAGQITNNSSSNWTFTGNTTNWATNATANIASTSTVGSIISILSTHYWVIIVGAFLSLILSFSWTYLLLRHAAIVTWLAVYFSLALCGTICGLSIYAYVMLMRSKLITTGTLLDLATGNQTVLMIFAVIFGVLFIMLAIISIGVRGKIRMAVKMIKHASMLLEKLPLIIFFPILKWAVMLALVAFFAYFYTLWSSVGYSQSATVEYILSGSHNGSSTANTTNVNATGTAYYQTTAVYVCQIYLLVVFFWTYYWILAIGEAAIAGAVAQYYWTPERAATKRFPVSKSLYRILRYHLGSLAFGSLIIAVVDYLRTFIELAQSQIFQRNLKTIDKQRGCFLRCCCRCAEKFLTSISKIAYIFVSMYGYSFCEAGHASFALIARHTTKMIVVDRVSTFLLFLGEIVIVLLTCLICLIGMFIQNRFQNFFSGTGFFTFSVPIVIVAIISVIISTGFMSVYWMTIETIFLCFCEDCERNDGSETHPYKMPNSLEDLIEPNENKSQQMEMLYKKQKSTEMAVHNPETNRMDNVSLYEFNQKRSELFAKTSEMNLHSLTASKTAKGLNRTVSAVIESHPISDADMKEISRLSTTPTANSVAQMEESRQSKFYEKSREYPRESKRTSIIEPGTRPASVIHSRNSSNRLSTHQRSTLQPIIVTKNSENDDSKLQTAGEGSPDAHAHSRRGSCASKRASQAGPALSTKVASIIEKFSDSNENWTSNSKRSSMMANALVPISITSERSQANESTLSRRPSNIQKKSILGTEFVAEKSIDEIPAIRSSSRRTSVQSLIGRPVSPTIQERVEMLRTSSQFKDQSHQPKLD